MSSVFYRNPQQEYPKGLRGEGVSEVVKFAVMR